MSKIVTVTFNYTGAQQTWVVPQGVTRITIDCYGAQGGYYSNPSTKRTSSPGLGGRARATFEVTPGETLYIYVGQSGAGQYRRTFGGGGAGGEDGIPLSGGGASDVRRGGNTLNHRIIVAGGGGGGGFPQQGTPQTGGHGGGSSGGDGLIDGSFRSSMCGRGATQSAGGAGAIGDRYNIEPGQDGSFGIGGDGSYNTGGGGGGWYGGGSGGLNTYGLTYGGPGGGGSGYIHPSATNRLFETGVRSGHGLVIITYEVIPPLYVRVNGQLKESESIHVKVNGQLREVDKIWTKVNGQLREV